MKEIKQDVAVRGWSLCTDWQTIDCWP